MKSKKSILLLIISLSFIAIILIFVMIFLINKRFKLNYFVSTNLVANEYFDTNFGSINIRTDASDINVINTNDEKVSVKIYGDANNYYILNNDGILRIEYKDSGCKFFCINRKISKIELYIPSDFNGKLNIDNNYGDIKVGSLKNSNISIKEDAGDVTIDGVNDITIKNKYGDIDLLEANIADINASAGQIKIGNVKNIKVENNYGDIKIDSVENYINASNDCGDIKIKFLRLDKDSSIVSHLGDIRIDDIDNIYVDAQTNLGDVKINKNYRNAEVVLKINNDCGDIKIG